MDFPVILNLRHMTFVILQPFEADMKSSILKITEVIQVLYVS